MGKHLRHGHQQQKGGLHVAEQLLHIQQGQSSNYNLPSDEVAELEVFVHAQKSDVKVNVMFSVGCRGVHTLPPLDSVNSSPCQGETE